MKDDVEFKHRFVEKFCESLRFREKPKLQGCKQNLRASTNLYKKSVPFRSTDFERVFKPKMDELTLNDKHEVPFGLL